MQCEQHEGRFSNTFCSGLTTGSLVCFLHEKQSSNPINEAIKILFFVVIGAWWWFFFSQCFPHCLWGVSSLLHPPICFTRKSKTADYHQIFDGNRRFWFATSCELRHRIWSKSSAYFFFKPAKYSTKSTNSFWVIDSCKPAVISDSSSFFIETTWFIL